MHIRNFTWGRAKKFYFALIAAGSAVVNGNFVDAEAAHWILGIVTALSAAEVWLFPNDPAVES